MFAQQELPPHVTEPFFEVLWSFAPLFLLMLGIAIILALVKARLQPQSFNLLVQLIGKLSSKPKHQNHSDPKHLRSTRDALRKGPRR